MADLKISQLAALASADLAAGDLLPVVDLSASETKKITVTDFTGKAVTLIADATIPGAKILFGASQVPGTALVDSAVTTGKIADDAVTAAKLANESTVDLVTTLPASGAFIGQLALDTDDLKVYCWDGSVWRSIKAAGSINTVNGDSTGIVNIAVATTGDTVTISTSIDNTSAAAQFLAGPTAAGGAVSYRTIAAGDLPTATTGAKGAVQVNGNGLSMTGDTIQIANTVTANAAAYHVVQYTAKGLVTAGRTIQSGDLPLAGASAVGAIYPGSGLSVAVDGQLNHTNTVTPGTSPKVTYNAQGHITAGASLAASDIPNLDASKITTGSLISDVLGAKTVTSAKMADYSTVKFGGASSTTGIVTFPVPEFTGQLFFDSSNGDLYLYDGNTWQPVTVISGDLVYAGTYNAATNTVKSVTTAGSAAGLVVGSALPAGSDARNRYYVVVSDAGNGISPAPVTALAPPDMLVCNGATWDLVDVSNAIAGQIASNISFTPYGGIASTNVQTALQELDDEKLAKVGGTVTGILEIGTTGSLVFEGSTVDGFETTLGVVEPTADRSVLLPNSSGTLITTGDTGVITSTMIADGAIVNADINALAAIADSKLATISTAGKVANSATTATSANTASAIVARDASGNFTGGTITATTFSGSGASLTSLPAGQLSGTIPSAVLGNSSVFLGTTSVALNRASANQALTGISSIALPGATSGSTTIQPSAVAGTTTITFPATTGTVVTTGDTGTITGTMIADGTIVNAEISASAAIAYSKLSLAGSIVNADIAAGAAIVDSKLATIATAGKVSNSATTATNLNTASAIVARDASGNFSAGTITAALLGNASTATTLQTARNIQGVSFNGSADITVVTAGTGISVTGTAVANTGVLSVNGSTGAVANVAVTNAAQSFSAAQRASISTLTDGATITPDFAVANNYTVTLAGNRTLAAPTNQVAGQSGSIFIVQDATGSRTLAYGADWDFAGGAAPTLSTAANAVDRLDYIVRASGSIHAILTKAYA